MVRTVLILCFLCVFLNKVHCAKILGMFTVPSISHQAVYQPIWRELSLRGHEVTVLTPNPLNDPTLTNLTEIDLSFSYEILTERNRHVQDVGYNVWLFTLISTASQGITESLTAQLADPVVQTLIQDETKHFDLVLVELFTPAIYALSKRFNCPFIGISSISTAILSDDLMGNPSDPTLFMPKFGSSRLFHRLYSYYAMFVFKYFYYHYLLPEHDKIARKYVSEDIPYLEDIEKNISMMFIYSNPIIHGVKPNVPSIIEISGINIKKKKPLPKDLQKELDDAREGFIYFSLGSNVRSANLSTELRTNIIECFAELPYKILWKWEDEHLPGQTKNIVIRKWFPQQDVLGHPNLKLFITQGGAQSMEEVIYNGVPVVGIPFFADQPINVMKMVELGVAQAVDTENLTKQQLKAAILEVIGNPKYRNKAQELLRLMSDMPMTGLEKAIWWTEYVIRHKGARHLRSPLIDLTWYEYYLLDLLSILVAIVLIFTFVLYKVVSLCLKIKNKLFKKQKAKVS